MNSSVSNFMVVSVLFQRLAQHNVRGVILCLLAVTALVTLYETLA